VTISLEELSTRLQASDPTLFVGSTAEKSLGWIEHPRRYLGAWLEELAAKLPNSTGRTVLLGMGGSSSPARFYAEAKGDTSLRVLDTSSPDSIASTEFSNCVVIASSKSGSTIETQTLLAHALANGLSPENLIVITDPNSSLEELGNSLGATVVLGDPNTGGRYSAISPFGLIPALYCGWTPAELLREHTEVEFGQELVARALGEAQMLVSKSGTPTFPLPSNPLNSGSALWLEQLVAETTGKEDVGLIPTWDGDSSPLKPSSMMFWQLVACLSARELGVDPFNQPNVESAKKAVLALLQAGDIEPSNHGANSEVKEDFQHASFRELNVYASIESDQHVEALRLATSKAFGPTAANIGPRYLHSTGQLFKGGPLDIATLQVVVRPSVPPTRIAGRRYSFHDLFFAQAIGDFEAMKASDRSVWQVVVESLDEVHSFLGLSA